jgi:tetratricopeptide (TPR) repeat protein
MKYLKRLFMLLLLVSLGNNVSAQNNTDARALVKEGLQLNDEKKYSEAVEKYKQALKLDSGYLFAGYQVALSLYALDKGTEGIPYLEKIITANSPLNGAAYDLLGLICFKNRQYAEAEQYAIEAIKLDPKHAGSQRMYALVTFHQNKRMNALLGFCSFILLEPNTPRTAEAYGNIQHILQGGVLKPEAGTAGSHAIDANTNLFNQIIAGAIAETAKRKYASAADLLAAQLKMIFTNAGKMAETKPGMIFSGNTWQLIFTNWHNRPICPLLQGCSAPIPPKAPNG